MYKLESRLLILLMLHINSCSLPAFSSKHVFKTWRRQFCCCMVCDMIYVIYGSKRRLNIFCEIWIKCRNLQHRLRHRISLYNVLSNRFVQQVAKLWSCVACLQSWRAEQRISKPKSMNSGRMITLGLLQNMAKNNIMCFEKVMVCFY